MILTFELGEQVEDIRAFEFIQLCDGDQFVVTST
jgi:hypothetical protein